MRHNDTQLTTPETLFSDTKANIEAIAAPVAGMKAFATDTHLEGVYSGTMWVWANMTLSGAEYYPDDIASDIGGFDVARRTPPTEVEQDDHATVTSGADVLLDTAYLSPLGDPAVTSLPAGMWVFHGYGYRENTGAGSSYVVAKIYYRTTGGVSTLIGEIVSPALTATSLGTVQEWEIELYTSAPTALDITDRLEIRFYGRTTASTREIHIVHSGVTHASHVTSPVTEGRQGATGPQGPAGVSLGVNDVDNAADPVYVGGTTNYGNWEVRRITLATNTIEYATLINNPGVPTYASAWSGRVGLTYGTYADAH
jgi:hypothetical protein